MCRSSRMIIKSEEKASGLPAGCGQRGQFLALIVLPVAQAWNFVIDSRVPLIVGPGRVWLENVCDALCPQLWLVIACWLQFEVVQSISTVITMNARHFLFWGILHKWKQCFHFFWHNGIHCTFVSLARVISVEHDLKKNEQTINDFDNRNCPTEYTLCIYIHFTVTVLLYTSCILFRKRPLKSLRQSAISQFA